MKTKFTRRKFLKTSALAAAAGMTAPLWTRRASAAPDSFITTATGRKLAAGPFEPTWESLVKNYKYPDWYRDAKFGIWAHWTAQCVPEQGDWYARRMYIQGKRIINITSRPTAIPPSSVSWKLTISGRRRNGSRKN